MGIWTRWDQSVVPGLIRHRLLLTRLAIAVMAAAAAVWLSYQFWRLLFQQGYWGAIDLGSRHLEVREWLQGRAIYGVLKNASYPPASYLMIAPLIGWLSFAGARWVWAVTTIASLIWIIRIAMHECDARGKPEPIFVALIPLSMYATGATIGNGQLTVHVAAMLLGGFMLLGGSKKGWISSLLPAILILLSLVKPSITAPFYWIVLFTPGAWRVALLVPAGYVALTLLASSFQSADPIPLLYSWSLTSSRLATKTIGAPSPHQAFVAMGYPQLVFPFSLGVLLLSGIWIFRHRSSDVWLLMGVAAVVARFWTYHQWFDEVLLFFPIIALYRVAKRAFRNDRASQLAGVLCALLMLSTLAPGGLYLFPSPFNMAYVGFQWVIWLCALVFLIRRAGIALET